MPVFAIPEAIQTEEGKCSEVLKDTDRAPEGKYIKRRVHFLENKIGEVSLPFLPQNYSHI
jgi:hypothetical protein